jgi:hypothetical protein
MRYLLLILLPANIFAAAFSYSGDWRAEVANYHNLSLSKTNAGQVSGDYLDPTNANYNPNAVSHTKTYWLQRFKLKPDLIVYDNVRVNSEWILLAGSALNSTSLGGQTGNYSAGTVMGSDNIQAKLFIKRLWLDWSSDWGVFQMGRQPFNFGLGMTYNSGDGLWDYYGESVDRISYKLMMGSVSLKFGYEILSEGAVNYYNDDQNGFMAEFGYNEPESNVDMGFSWHMYFASGQRRVHTYDVFQKKLFPTTGITIGWEAAYQKGSMPDQNGNNTMDQVQAFGLLFDFLWKPGASEFGLKTGMATGDNNPGDGKYYTFSFSRAYKIAMLLFNEDLGIAGDSVHGSQGIGADFNGLGTIFIAPTFAYTFMDSLKVGTTFAYAMTQKRPSAGANNTNKKSLGSELDIDATYKWKENLETGLRMGWFFPSGYFASRATAMGIMATVALTF